MKEGNSTITSHNTTTTSKDNTQVKEKTIKGRKNPINKSGDPSASSLAQSDNQPEIEAACIEINKPQR